MNMAKEILLKAYEKMKNTVTPRFTENLSKNINNITDGKYTNVVLQDDNGLVVESKLKTMDLSLYDEKQLEEFAQYVFNCGWSEIGGKLDK